MLVAAFTSSLGAAVLLFNGAGFKEDSGVPLGSYFRLSMGFGAISDGTQSRVLSCRQRRLTHSKVQVNILSCWFPDANRGRKKGTRAQQIRALEFEEIRGCPRNCERRALGPTRPLGNWEGRTTKADDPRARRPASTVTQPVDGASIRSGLSQR